MAGVLVHTVASGGALVSVMSDGTGMAVEESTDGSGLLVTQVAYGGRPVRYTPAGADQGGLGWQATGSIFDADFKRNLYYGSLISVARASDSYIDDSLGSWKLVAQNGLRRSNKGALVEAGGTNLFANPLAPATQTVAVVSGTIYTVSLRGGAGSITLSDAGTGTVTPGSPVTFTAGSTSLTATVAGVSGAFTHMQCETGAFATSPIVGARSPDFVTVQIPATGTGITMLVQMVPYVPATSTVVQNLLSISDGGVSNRLTLARTSAGGSGISAIVVGGVAQTAASVSDVMAQNVSSKMAMAVTTGSAAVSVNGGAPVPAAPSSIPTGLTVVGIGNQGNAGGYARSYIERVTVWPTRLSDAQLQALTS